MKPILFNTDMVRAILEGRKTVTRRVVKPRYRDGEIGFNVITNAHTGKYVRIEYFDEWEDETRYMPEPYRPGNILYVSETWKCSPDSQLWADNEYRVIFKDGEMVRFYFENQERLEKWRKYIYKPLENWQSPYFMPREAARIFLRVTDMWVEQLQTPFFNQSAAIFALQEEGVDVGAHCQGCVDFYGCPCCIDGESECGELDYVRGGFSDLWDSTIKPADRALYGWAADPWVWVIEFERCERPDEG